MNFEELEAILSPKKEYIDPRIAQQEAYRLQEEARREARRIEQHNRLINSLNEITNWVHPTGSRTIEKYGYFKDTYENGNNRTSIFAVQRKNTIDIEVYSLSNWNLDKQIQRLQVGVSPTAVLKSISNNRIPTMFPPVMPLPIVNEPTIP